MFSLTLKLKQLLQFSTNFVEYFAISVSYRFYGPLWNRVYRPLKNGKNRIGH